MSKKRLPKIVHPSDQTYQYVKDNKVKACYLPNIPINEISEKFIEQLETIPFTRVIYISQYGKKNRTPRFTWSYGKVDSDTVSFTKRGYTLNFNTEKMPPFLQKLGDYCRKVSIHNWGFDPGYNSCIIGRYEDRDDSIGFHFDTESFLEHHFCANVTIGCSRDFQFRDEETPKRTHEIKLQNNSLFFFKGLEHSLPKRAAVKKGDVRYSISFRNMSKDLGIANSFYYCRGLEGAIDDDDKVVYKEKLDSL